MRITMDRVGRIVIPKRIREALGLTADSELEITLDGTSVRLEPVRSKDRVIEMRDGVPLLGRVDDIQLTDVEVNRLRDDLQR